MSDETPLPKDLEEALDKQTGSTAQERQEFHDTAVRSRGYKRLDSVLQNVVNNASKFSTFDLNKIDIQDLYGFLHREGIDVKALAALTSDVLTETVAAMSPDPIELGRALIAHNLNESQVKAAMTMFALGYRLHQRNTALPARIMTGQKESDAPDKAEGTEVPTP